MSGYEGLRVFGKAHGSRFCNFMSPAISSGGCHGVEESAVMLSPDSNWGKWTFSREWVKASQSDWTLENEALAMDPRAMTEGS